MAEFAEVTLDGFPGTAGGDGHLLVAVADRAAGSESVAEPEAILPGKTVGNVGEAGRSLVGSDDQVEIVRVATAHIAGRDDLAIDQIVSQIKQAANIDLVAFDAFGQPGFAFADRRQAFADKAAFGAERDDDGILDRLRLDQSQHLGAVIVKAVGPAQAAARDTRTAQVQAFSTGAVDENFIERQRLGQEGDFPRGELEREIVFRLAILAGLPGVGAQRGQNDGAEGRENLVVFELADLRQCCFQFVSKHLALCLFAIRRQAGGKQFKQQTGDLRVAQQAAFDLCRRKGQSGLAQITGVGAQNTDLHPIQTGEQGEAVETVVLCGITQELLQKIDKGGAGSVIIQRLGTGKLYGKIGQTQFAFLEPETLPGKHGHPEIVKDRQNSAQRTRRLSEGNLDVLVRAIVMIGRIEPDPDLATRFCNVQVFEIAGRRSRWHLILISQWQHRRIAPEQGIAALLTAMLDEFAL